MLFCLILIIQLNFVSLSSFTEERLKGQICPPSKRQNWLLNWNLVPMLFSLLQRCYMNPSFHNVMTWELENIMSIQTSPCHRSHTPVPYWLNVVVQSHKYLDAFPGQNQKKFYLIFLCFGAMTNKWLTCLRWYFLLKIFLFNLILNWYVCQTLGPYARFSVTLNLGFIKD